MTRAPGSRVSDANQCHPACIQRGICLIGLTTKMQPNLVVNTDAHLRGCAPCGAAPLGARAAAIAMRTDAAMQHGVKRRCFVRASSPLALFRSGHE